MDALLWIIAITLLDGILALVGAFGFLMKKDTLAKVSFVLVSFSAGALFAGGLFHMLSESLLQMSSMEAFSYLVVGFILFFIIERVLRWHHCHEQDECKTHPFSYLILVGDSVHNFIDGLVIAASFLVGIPFGIITSILIIGHEIPQEIANFGVLVYGGFSRTKSLLSNFAVQLTAIIGGLVGYFFVGSGGLSTYLLPFAAGGFIYIATSDLIPELHREENTKKATISFIILLLGIIFMVWLKVLFE